MAAVVEEIRRSQRKALKYANSLLEDVLKAIDTNRDGRITYPGQLLDE